MNIDKTNKELLKLFKGYLSTKQESGIDTIIEEAGDIDKRHLAYILATVFHETGRMMQPSEEAAYLSPEHQAAYLKSKSYYPYHGRDLVHTTHKENYQKVKDFTGIDVVTLPALIGKMPMAAKVAIHFMQEGHFTTKKLSDYFNDEISDPINARRIINGVRKGEKLPDKAELIKSYYNTFLNSLY